MKARLLIPLLLTGLLAGCGRGPVKLETRTFALRYLSSAEAEQIVRPYVFEDRPGAKGALSAGQRSLTVRETPDNLDRIGVVLTRFDRPQPSVRLTFKVIRADGAARPDSSIRDVESALRSLFRFKGYALVAEGVVTATSNSSTTQVLHGRDQPYLLSSEVKRIAGPGDSAIVTLRVTLGVPQAQARFETQVGIPVGKTAVLGNVTGGSSSSALILTVRPELVRE